MDRIELLFLQLLNLSITGAYVIFAVLFFRFCIRKAPKIFSYGLWSVVGFRLLSPVSFTSVFSIFSLRLFDMTKAQRMGAETLYYVPYDVGLMEEPQVTVGVSYLNTAISQTLPPAEPYASINPMQLFVFIGACIWLAGFLALILYGLYSYRKVGKLTDHAVLEEGNIYRLEGLPSPFVFGLLHPRIYVPYGMDLTAHSHILLHERCHIERKDHLIKPFAYFLLCLHWFNPLVWVAYRLMNRDLEMSCDEKVIRKMGAGIKEDYSLSLLSIARRNGFSAAGPIAFGESDVKERVKNTLKFKMPGKKSLLGLIALCLVIAAACIFNPAAGAEINNENLQGYYKFEECAYINPLSSFTPMEDNMPYYGITDNSLLVIDRDSGEADKYTLAYDLMDVTARDLVETAEDPVFAPDLSQYQSLKRIASCTLDSDRELEIYRANSKDYSELYLANVHGDQLWSLYKITRTDGLNDRAITLERGGEDNEAPDWAKLYTRMRIKDLPLTKIGWRLDLCENGLAWDTALIQDDAGMDFIKGLVMDYNLKSSGTEAANVYDAGWYFTFYSLEPEESTDKFYVFYDEEVNVNPQMQVFGGPRKSITNSQYEDLFDLFEENIKLPEYVKVSSGNSPLIDGLVFRSGKLSDEDLFKLAGELEYIEVDKKYADHDLVLLEEPFNINAAGFKQRGIYRIFDAETFEYIPHIETSGVPTEYYLLRGTEPGRRYIVEQQSGYWYEGEIYGMKIVFGIEITE